MNLFLKWGLSLFLVVALYGLGWVFEENIDPYILRVIINCGIACILSLSLNLINGCAGQFSLGHAGFMAVGAYVSSSITTVIPLGPLMQTPVGVGFSLLVGGGTAAFVGYLVGLPSLRLKGDYLAIVTLGFGEIIRVLFLNIPAVGGPRGLPGIPRVSNFFWVYLWVGITFLFLFRLIRSSQGRAILSIREDEVAAQAMGIDISHYKVVAFILSSFFAGIAGGLFAHFQGFIDPGSFSFNRSVEVVIMVVIGGMGSFSGALIGALVVTVLPEMLRVFETLRMVIFPAILIAMMLWRPMGFLGRKEIWELFRREAE